MISLSIIIPVYNGAAYMDRCIKSINSSGIDSSSVEIIAIDDASTDGSKTILQSWAAKQPNITILEQKSNQRQGAARNRGLSAAKGTYVMFVDCDDTVGTDLEEIVNYAMNCRHELVLARMSWQTQPNGNFSYPSFSMTEKELFTGKEYCEHYYQIISGGSPCNYLFRRDYLLASGIRFIEGRRFEDVDWVEKILYNSNSISFINKHIYSYYMNPGSTMNHFSAERDADAICYCKRRIEFATSIASAAPIYSSTIFAHCNSWVKSIFSFRHISRFSPHSLRLLYKNIGSDTLSYISAHSELNGFASFAIMNAAATIVLDSVVFPIAASCRAIVHSH